MFVMTVIDPMRNVASIHVTTGGAKLALDLNDKMDYMCIYLNI